MTTRARSGGIPARRGRGSGRGRGNTHVPRSTNREARRTPTRARARSAAPLRGGRADATEMAALREQIETMKTSLDAANGKVRQLESKWEDRVAAAGAGSTSAGKGRTPTGDTLPAEDATPGAYFDRTRAPSQFPSMAHVTNARAKESLAAWRNLSILKCWILIGERPTVANLKLMEMQSLLREKVRVTTGVLEQLNAMSGFRVRSYIAEGDDPHLTRTTLIRHLETLIDAVLTLLSLGIESEDGTTRLEILRQLFRNGTDLIRDHCRQHRGKMQDPGTFKMMADMVDDDLGRWSSAWFTRALAFQKQHQTPPEIEFMPPVIGPQWTVVGDYIAGGGLRNVTTRSSYPIKSPTKRPRSEKFGAAGDNVCFLDDRPGSCNHRNCPWEHTKKPSRRASIGAGGTRDGRGDHGGASGGDSGRGGRESGGNSLSDGGGGGGAAIAGPVIAAGVPPAPRDTGSATRQGQLRSTHSARLR